MVSVTSAAGNEQAERYDSVWNAIADTSEEAANLCVRGSDPATLVRVLTDKEIKITPMGIATESPVPPLTPELMKAVEAITADMWPGIPVISVMSSGGTDGRFLNNAGTWTYGITGGFQHPGGSNAPGLNEKMLVESRYEAHHFQYRLGKRLGEAPLA